MARDSNNVALAEQEENLIPPGIAGFGNHEHYRGPRFRLVQ
jgi:hypothetical protein